MFAWETHGVVVVFGFGQDEIGGAVRGVAWLQCQKTRAGVACPRRPRTHLPPPCHWWFEAPRRPPVWHEDPLDVSSFASFSALGVLEA